MCIYVYIYIEFLFNSRDIDIKKANTTNEFIL